MINYKLVLCTDKTDIITGNSNGTWMDWMLKTDKQDRALVPMANVKIVSSPDVTFQTDHQSCRSVKNRKISFELVLDSRRERSYVVSTFLREVKWLKIVIPTTATDELTYCSRVQLSSVDFVESPYEKGVEVNVSYNIITPPVNLPGSFNLWAFSPYQPFSEIAQKTSDGYWITTSGVEIIEKDRPGLQPVWYTSTIPGISYNVKNVESAGDAYFGFLDWM